MGKFFRQTHRELSLFFLPLALLYAISGVLYVAGFNQDLGAKIWKFSLPISQVEVLPSAINQYLAKHQLRMIEDTQLKRGKNHTLVMGSIDYSATISKSQEEFHIKVIQRSFLGDLMMLHKGKGKWYFDILSFGFVGALMFLYLSGLMMTKFCKQGRKRALWIVSAGLIVTMIAGILSVTT